MLFFNLNLDKYDGEISQIIDIKMKFLDKISNLENVNCFWRIHSTDFPFLKYPYIYNKDMVLEAVDNEQSKFSSEDIISCIEKAHIELIPGLEKSLNDLGLRYDFIIEISNKEYNNSLRDYMAENNLQFAFESIGNTNMTLEEKINFISNELKELGAENNTLIIMDPYIFPKKHDSDYLDFFLGFIKKSKIKN